MNASIIHGPRWAMHGLLGAFALVTMASSAKAQSTGTWISNGTGAVIPVPTVDYGADIPFQGTASVSLTGLDFGADVGHLDFYTGLVTPPSAVPVNWSNPLNWDSPVVPFQWLGNVTSHLIDGTIASYNTSDGVTYDFLNTVGDLVHGGPTEGTTSISVPVPDFPFISLSIGTTVEFDVHIDTGQAVNVDQNATVQSLTML